MRNIWVFSIFNGRVNKDHFNFIVDHMQNRLASWKCKLLNKADRVTLVKFVLFAIPTYCMQLNWFPSSVCVQIDKIANNFIWKGSSGKGIHLVSWDKITRPRKDGGKDFRPARDSNITLLGKLVWDMKMNRDKLWVSLLYHKYVKYGDFLLCPSSSYGSFIWRSIVKAKGILKEGYHFRIGKSLFWYAPWTPFGPLCNSMLAIDIHDTQLQIKDLYDQNIWNWDILWTALPIQIRDYINSIQPIFNDFVSDSFVWTSSPTGEYTVK